MSVIPRLADVSCKQIQFRPGDRVLVRLRHRIDAEARRRLQRGVEKWAGNCVEVFVYCPEDMQIDIEQR